MKTSDFDYHLPEELIAQYPADRRDESRMMTVNAATGEISVVPFPALVDFLSAGDLLVSNDTRVMKSRLYGVNENTGGRFELLLVAPMDAEKRRWKSLIRPGRRALPGTRILLAGESGLTDGKFSCSVVGRCDEEAFEIEFADGAAAEMIQERFGHVPLPPYIRRADGAADAERYQTIFAKIPGAVAAPTAGLHFSPEVMAGLARRGVGSVQVTLHVGPGTFKPVEVDDPSRHRMHREEYFVTPSAAGAINSARDAGKKILAVGTTTIRTLESCIDGAGRIVPGRGETEIFIYPPYQIRSAQLLLTNFHLPKSTLMMLVATMTGRELLLEAYARAIEQRMRFYSYGDCMLIYGGA